MAEIHVSIQRDLTVCNENELDELVELLISVILKVIEKDPDYKGINILFCLCP